MSNADLSQPRPTSPAISSLNLNLAELVLAFSVRLTAISSLWTGSAIAMPLNATLRQHMPMVSKAALAQMPWINVTVASRIGDVDLLRFLLQWSKQPGGRPLTPYSGARAVHSASELGHMDILSWWFDESGLGCWDWMDKSVDVASSKGHVHVLQWWLDRSQAAVVPFKHSEQALLAASVAGHVHVLDWFLHHVSRKQLVWSGENDAFMHAVAKKGSIPVLEWWIQSGLPHRLDHVLTGAFAGNQVHVLEWIWNHHLEIVFRHRLAHEDQKWPGTGPLTAHKYTFRLPLVADDSPLCHAIKSKESELLTWIDRLQLYPTSQDQHEATRVACQVGDMERIAWLLNRSWFAARKSECIMWAAHSGNLELMDWLYSLPGVVVFSAIDNPVLAACQQGHVGVLDWLLDHGFCSELDELWSSTFMTASECGHVCVLDWLWSLYLGLRDCADYCSGNEFDSQCELEVALLATTAVAGHLHVLQWWAAHVGHFPASLAFDGCLNDTVFSDICSTGRLDVLQWMFDQSCNGRPLQKLFNYCPGIKCYPSAILAGDLAALVFFSEHTESFDVGEAACLASRLERLEMLEWLFDNGQNLVEFVQSFSLSVADLDKERYPLKSLNWWRANVFPRLKDGGRRLVARYVNDPVRETAEPHELFLLQSVLNGL